MFILTKVVINNITSRKRRIEIGRVQHKESLMVKDIEKSLVKQLESLYAANEAAHTVLDWAAGRQKDAKTTRIDRIAYLADLPRNEVIAVARELEDAGLCKFVAGRHGRPSRIKWLYSLRSLGEAAKGASMRLEEIDATAEEEEDDATGEAGEER